MLSDRDPPRRAYTCLGTTTYITLSSHLNAGCVNKELTMSPSRKFVLAVVSNRDVESFEVTNLQTNNQRADYENLLDKHQDETNAAGTVEQAEFINKHSKEVDKVGSRRHSTSAPLLRKIVQIGDALG